MSPPIFALLFFTLVHLRLGSSALVSLTRGSFLSVERPSDVLVSPTGSFSAGFFPVGENAFTFAIWHGVPVCSGGSCVPVWMVSRGSPVNGERSRLSLTERGNLILTDAGKFIFPVWSLSNGSSKAAKLQLSDTGNLVLVDEGGETLWQSFDFPTDTLLPAQIIQRGTRVISSRSRYNYSEGSYSLHFSDDEVLRLIYNGPTLPVSYWPPPWLPGRFTSKSSRSAVLDSLGHFLSTDTFEFFSSDYGTILPRRLTLDPDGNLRLYSLNTSTRKWSVTWDAFSGMSCFIFGVCGNNSICSYDRTFGRTCSCVPGYERVDPSDWSYGCKPTFQLSHECSRDVGFVKVPYVDFYGNDYSSTSNITFKNCQSMCAGLCSCRGFQYTFDNGNGIYNCYLKTELFNGNNLPSFSGEFFIKVNKSVNFTKDQLQKRTRYNCTGGNKSEELDRKYRQERSSAVIRFMLWLAVAVAGIETVIVSLEGGGDVRHVRLVSWVQQKMRGPMESGWGSVRVEGIVDPTLMGNYDKRKMEALIHVALRCVEVDREMRPTMKEVVEMLLSYDDLS
ncbi:hypothetical protein SAY87_003981 [Trapa incisa]|uniref:Uncharacterized protein n=1 Tax=Trapa incisa TaxID=236973 RepID=A0AAN7PL74_9MYRT|nr:hypothetical protein SAY87_003981 [Trapa incisa]